MSTKSMRFIRWQKEKASQEREFMATAELVEKYLSMVSFSQIKPDVEDTQVQSASYQLIQKAHRPGRAVLLYCTLDIEEAIDLLSRPREQKILVALKNDLAAMYESYRDRPAERIKALLENFSSFLQIKTTDFSNKKKAKELYYTIYLSLCITNHGLNNLPPGSGFLAAWYKVNIEQIHGSVLALMKQIEEKIMTFDSSEKHEKDPTTLDHRPTVVDATPLASTLLGGEIASVVKENIVSSPVVIRPEQDVVSHRAPLVTKVSAQSEPALVEQMAMPVSQRAIQNYIDKRYLALFLNGTSTPEQLKAIIAVSGEIKSGIEQVLAARAQEQMILTQKTKIEGLLEAFNRNDRFIYGRQYFSDLKAAHQDVFKMLIDLSAGTQRTALLATIDAQKQNTRSANVLYYTSTALSPLIALSRAFLPEKTQEYLASWTPQTLQTFDAQAKNLTKDLAKSVLLDLQKQLSQVRAEKQQRQDALTLGDASLDKLIAEESSESLLELATANAVAQTSDELVASLVVNTGPLVHVKAEIQDVIQQRYVNLMQGSTDEKGKIDTLIGTMRVIVKDLNALMELKVKREGLLVKAGSLERLMDFFNKQTSNKLIGPVANESLRQIRKELEELSREMSVVASRLSLDNESLKELLMQLSIEDLRELISANTVAEEIDNLLLSIVTSLPAVGALLPGEKTVPDYLIERYRSLVNHDAHEEEQRLDNLLQSLDEVDQKIELLIAARAEYDVIALKAQQVRDVFNALELNKANPLLINLVKERTLFLDGHLALAQRKMNSLAQILAVGKEPLKQLFLQEKPSVLLKVLEMNKEAKECIAQYKLLKDKIVILNQVNQGTRVLDTYASEHYTWWVRLTDFLAQFFSIFKTNASKMIDQAKELKGQLITCRVQCEQEILSHIAVIKHDSDIGNDLLADLPEHHDYEPVSEPDEVEALDTDKTTGLLSQVSIFKPKAKNVVLEKAEEQLDSRELYDSSLVQSHC